MRHGSVLGARVLLIEDERALTRVWCRTLRAAGFEVTAAATVAEAEALALDSFQVVLLDLVLPDGDGEQVLARLGRLHPRPAVAVITGHLDSERAARLCGQCDTVVPKPVSRATVIGLVQRLLELRRPGSLLAAFCRFHGLSPRETEVLTASLNGHDVAAIAAELDCQPGTLKTYWQRILKKTGCETQRDVTAALLRFDALTG